MIIRINVQDNDYGKMVADVLSKRVNGLWQIYDDYFDTMMNKYDGDDMDSLLKFKEVAIQRDNIKDWFFDDRIPEENLKEVEYIIKECVLHLLSNSLGRKSLTYLRELITITFPKTMEAKWENGEVIYYFPNTYSKNKFMLF